MESKKKKKKYLIFKRVKFSQNNIKYEKIKTSKLQVFFLKKIVK